MNLLSYKILIAFWLWTTLTLADPFPGHIIRYEDFSYFTPDLNTNDRYTTIVEMGVFSFLENIVVGRQGRLHIRNTATSPFFNTQDPHFSFDMFGELVVDQNGEFVVDDSSYDQGYTEHTVASPLVSNNGQIVYIGAESYPRLSVHFIPKNFDNYGGLSFFNYEGGSDPNDIINIGNFVDGNYHSDTYYNQGSMCFFNTKNVIQYANLEGEGCVSLYNEVEYTINSPNTGSGQNYIFRESNSVLTINNITPDTPAINIYSLHLDNRVKFSFNRPPVDIPNISKRSPTLRYDGDNLYIEADFIITFHVGRGLNIDAFDLQEECNGDNCIGTLTYSSIGNGPPYICRDCRGFLDFPADVFDMIEFDDHAQGIMSTYTTTFTTNIDGIDTTQSGLVVVTTLDLWEFDTITSLFPPPPYTTYTTTEANTDYNGYISTESGVVIVTADDEGSLTTTTSLFPPPPFTTYTTTEINSSSDGYVSTDSGVVIVTTDMEGSLTTTTSLFPPPPFTTYTTTVYSEIDTEGHLTIESGIVVVTTDSEGSLTTSTSFFPAPPGSWGTYSIVPNSLPPSYTTYTTTEFNSDSDGYVSTDSGIVVVTTDDEGSVTTTTSLFPPPPFTTYTTTEINTDTTESGVVIVTTDDEGSLTTSISLYPPPPFTTYTTTEINIDTTESGIVIVTTDIEGSLTTTTSLFLPPPYTTYGFTSTNSNPDGSVSTESGIVVVTTADEGSLMTTTSLFPIQSSSRNVVQTSEYSYLRPSTFNSVSSSFIWYNSSTPAYTSSRAIASDHTYASLSGISQETNIPTETITEETGTSVELVSEKTTEEYSEWTITTEIVMTLSDGSLTTRTAVIIDPTDSDGNWYTITSFLEDVEETNTIEVEPSTDDATITEVIPEETEIPKETGSDWSYTTEIVFTLSDGVVTTRTAVVVDPQDSEGDWDTYTTFLDSPEEEVDATETVTDDITITDSVPEQSEGRDGDGEDSSTSSTSVTEVYPEATTEVYSEWTITTEIVMTLSDGSIATRTAVIIDPTDSDGNWYTITSFLEDVEETNTIEVEPSTDDATITEVIPEETEIPKETGSDWSYTTEILFTLSDGVVTTRTAIVVDPQNSEGDWYTYTTFLDGSQEQEDVTDIVTDQITVTEIVPGETEASDVIEEEATTDDTDITVPEPTGGVDTIEEETTTAIATITDVVPEETEEEAEESGSDWSYTTEIIFTGPDGSATTRSAIVVDSQDADGEWYTYTSFLDDSAAIETGSAEGTTANVDVIDVVDTTDLVDATTDIDIVEPTITDLLSDWSYTTDIVITEADGSVTTRAAVVVDPQNTDGEWYTYTSFLDDADEKVVGTTQVTRVVTIGTTIFVTAADGSVETRSVELETEEVSISIPTGMPDSRYGSDNIVENEGIAANEYITSLVSTLPNGEVATETVRVVITTGADGALDSRTYHVLYPTAGVIEDNFVGQGEVIVTTNDNREIYSSTCLSAGGCFKPVYTTEFVSELDDGSYSTVVAAVITGEDADGVLFTTTSIIPANARETATVYTTEVHKTYEDGSEYDVLDVVFVISDENGMFTTTSLLDLVEPTGIDEEVSADPGVPGSGSSDSGDIENGNDSEENVVSPVSLHEESEFVNSAGTISPTTSWWIVSTILMMVMI